MTKLDIAKSLAGLGGGSGLRDGYSANAAGQVTSGGSIEYGEAVEDSEDGWVEVRLNGDTDTISVACDCTVRAGDSVCLITSHGNVKLVSLAGTTEEVAAARRGAHEAQEAAEEAKEDAAAAAASAQDAADSASAAQASASAAATSASGAATAAENAAASASNAEQSASDAAGQAAAATGYAQTAAGQAAAAASSASDAADSASAAQADATAANTAANGALSSLATVQGVVSALETDVDDLQSHVALTDEGLWVTLDAAGYRLLLAHDGAYVVDPQGVTVSTFGESITYSSSRPQYIGNEDAFIAFYDSDGDGQPDSIRIGGSNIVMGGSKTLSQVLAEIAASSAAITAANPFVEGTQTAATRFWTGSCPQLSALSDGQQLTYWVPYAYLSETAKSKGIAAAELDPAETITSKYSNCWLKLDLESGDTGWVPVFYGGTTRVTSHYGANTCVHLTYREGVAGTTRGWWADANYDSNNYDRTRFNNAVLAASAVSASRVIVGDSAGYANAAAGVSFDLSYPVLWAGSSIAAGGTGTNNYTAFPGCTLRNNKPGATLSQYEMAYLVGTLSGSTFTIADAVFANAPAAADGLQYIPIGYLYSTHQVYFNGGLPTVYEYGEDGFAPISSNAAALAQQAASDAESALETALDGAFLQLESTNGLLFKNGSESTVLKAVVFPNGGDKLEEIGDVRARFGAAAYIEWKWKQEDSGSWGTIVSSDSRLSHGGMWLSVSPGDVDTKTTFSASLVVP